MAWFYLILAGLLEIGWAIGMKYTNGFTRLWPTAATFATMTVSFYLLSLSLKTIPMGTAYAVWTGIGAVGTALVGIIWFKDPATFWRLFFLAGVIGCLIGLKLASPDHD